MPPGLLFDAEDRVEQVMVEMEAGVAVGAQGDGHDVDLVECAAPLVLDHLALDRCMIARSVAIAGSVALSDERVDNPLLRLGERLARTGEFDQRLAVVEEDAVEPA